MRHTTQAILAALAALALQRPAPARAEVDLRVNLDLRLPVAPPLVTIQPGVMVVEDFDDEVFVVGGVYWTRREDRWYRAPGPRAAFVHVDRHRVPPALVRLPPGQYKKWRKKHPEAAARLEGRGDDHRGHDHDHDRGHDRGHDDDRGKHKHKGKDKDKGHDRR